MHMRRREFITYIGGVAASWPLAARAQPAKLRTVGVLGTDPIVWQPWTGAFVERLRALGWVEGRTLAMEYRWDEGRLERDTDVAAEFVQLKVDVILTTAVSVSAIKQKTTFIPIVFAISIDPVAGGLVASLARPGGNATGLSIQAADLAGKRLELLRGVVPQIRRIAIIGDGGFAQSVLEMDQARAAARSLGLEGISFGIRTPEDIAPALGGLKAPADALYVASDALVNANRTQIIDYALSARLPTIFSTRGHVQAGGLMSYGASFPDLFRRAADLVDKILHGAKPAEIPVEQPTKFELVINLKTARTLGLTVPSAILATVDETFE
jgi:putative ABC transport system substrate-binding protein